MKEDNFNYVENKPMSCKSCFYYFDASYDGNNYDCFNKGEEGPHEYVPGCHKGQLPAMHAVIFDICWIPALTMDEKKKNHLKTLLEKMQINHNLNDIVVVTYLNLLNNTYLWILKDFLKEWGYWNRWRYNE